jgi:hypothetical protein
MMSGRNRNIDTYLSDHLAGSVAALEMLSHLEYSHLQPAHNEFVTALRGDIEADQHELKQIMERLQVTQSGPRRAAAWLAEKAARFKLWVDDSSTSPLYWLEAMETIALGLDGKRALWRSLAVAQHAPELRDVDFERLEERAEEQRARVEAMRLEAAHTSLWNDVPAVAT